MSLGSGRNGTVFELDAAIEPGKGAAGVHIGQPTASLPALVLPARTTALVGCNLLDFGPVQLWTRSGSIYQIGVGIGYRGRIAGQIGIGSRVRDVECTFGAVTEDEEDNLVVARMPGWCFETETWASGLTVEENLEARITVIYVFAEQAA